MVFEAVLQIHFLIVNLQKAHLPGRRKVRMVFLGVDVVKILTDSPEPKRYWRVFKVRLKKGGVQPTTICSTLKLKATDGKMRMTDVDGKSKIGSLSLREEILKVS